MSNTNPAPPQITQNSQSSPNSVATQSVFDIELPRSPRPFSKGDLRSPYPLIIWTPHTPQITPTQTPSIIAPTTSLSDPTKSQSTQIPHNTSLSAPNFSHNSNSQITQQRAIQSTHDSHARQPPTSHLSLNSPQIMSNLLNSLQIPVAAPTRRSNSTC